MSGASITNPSSQQIRTQLAQEQIFHQEYLEKLQQQTQRDHQRETERHDVYVALITTQNERNSYREQKRHEDYVKFVTEQNRLEHVREENQHEEFPKTFTEQNRQDNLRAGRLQEDFLKVLNPAFVASQRSEIVNRYNQRKEELNSLLNADLEAEKNQHEQRITVLRNQLKAELETENNKHRKRKAELNNQISNTLQAETDRYERRKVSIDLYHATALQAETTRHEQRKASLNTQLSAALLTEATPSEQRNRQLNQRQSQAAERSTLPLLSVFSNSRTATSASTIIQQELEKLIALDPEMANYKFDHAFICPISASLMLDPVFLIKSGNTYDRKEIERWFSRSNIEPLTGIKLNEKALAPNNLVRGQILAVLQKLYNEASAREEHRKRPESNQNRKRHQLG